MKDSLEENNSIRAGKLTNTKNVTEERAPQTIDLERFSPEAASHATAGSSVVYNSDFAQFPSPWEHVIIVIRHHYYDRKQAFEQDADRYTEWAAFAVTEGDFEWRTGEAPDASASASQYQSANTGQIVICPPGLLFRRRTGKPISFHYFLFHFTNNEKTPVDSSFYQQAFLLSFQSLQRVSLTLDTLRSPVSVMHAAYPQWRSHALLDLFRQFALEQSINFEPAAGQQTSASEDKLMHDARGMLDSAANEPLSIAAVASFFGLNAVQFSRRFQRAFGQKPSQYVERIKLGKVCHLLTHTRMTLEEIAIASGFSNGFYLSRFFSLKMGMPPSEYRRQHRI
ncbi:AraC family transcriptional regulator [Paenibacillus sp. HB172176]|uniref:helix-turn-helix domain-containing protein n=1 Tax=Paenibacillus sp. HB172176 TaxID=2493690 RepID=UPI00143C20D1|nr:AraC family transcriptional regulator [Paenibacillus sp. HB172176]